MLPTSTQVGCSAVVGLVSLEARASEFVVGSRRLASFALLKSSLRHICVPVHLLFSRRFNGVETRHKEKLAAAHACAHAYCSLPRMICPLAELVSVLLALAIDVCVLWTRRESERGDFEAKSASTKRVMDSFQASPVSAVGSVRQQQQQQQPQVRLFRIISIRIRHPLGI